MGKHSFDHLSNSALVISTPSFVQQKEAQRQKWVCRLDPVGHPTFINDTCRRFFNIKPQDILREQKLPFVLEEDMHKLSNSLSLLSPINSSTRVELRLLLPGGAIRIHSWEANAIFDDDGAPEEYLLTTEEPVKAEDSKKSPQGDVKRHEIRIDNVFNAFVLFESLPMDCRNFPQFRLIEANPAFEELTGINMETALGRTLTEMLPDTQSAWLDLLNRIVTRGEGVRFKNFFKSFGKHFEIIAYSPCRGQVAMIISDVTSCARTEEALRSSEASFRAIAENAREGIVVAYEFSGQCVYANRHAGKLLGYGVDEVLKMSLSRLFSEAEIREFNNLRAERRHRGETEPETFETELQRKDGELVRIEAHASTITWQGQTADLIMFRETSFNKQIVGYWTDAIAQIEPMAQERASNLDWANAMLVQKENELNKNRMNLKRLNRELVHTNKALSVMARNIDQKRQKLMAKITRTVTSRILPAIDEIGDAKIPESCRAQLDVIRAYLNDLITDNSMGSGVIFALSKMELRVAIMIKNGFNTFDIARLLHLSELTVKTHRRNIRKKLGISNSKINLFTFLRLKLSKSQFLSNPKLTDSLANKAL